MVDNTGDGKKAKFGLVTAPRQRLKKTRQTPMFHMKKEWENIEDSS